MAGDFNTPNLMDAGSTEMDYVLGTTKQADKWYKFKVESTVITIATDCYSGSACLEISDR